MSKSDLVAHLASGHTHVCQCWMIKRRDGRKFGFTDHDQPLFFEGVEFVADSGMSAKALATSTGLSVNNTEAVGMLRSNIVTEQDILAGRYDGAEVTNWLVQWDNVEARKINFVGTVGEFTRKNGAFEVELRSLADTLNQPQGQSYLRTCAAVLGDQRCKIDTDVPEFSTVATVANLITETVIGLPIVGYQNDWFEHGILRVLNGQAAGLSQGIKSDKLVNGMRKIEVWQSLPIAAGDQVKVIAGCDKRAETCRDRFANLANFRGFPHIPGDDWLVSVPRSDGSANGGSLFS